MHDTKGARATKRFGSATWNGDLREGKGSVSTECRALESHPYTFFSRYGGKPGTNPDHARDHEQNASTSAMRFVGSTRANPYACAAAAIAARRLTTFRARRI
jgi:hypothetical protein